MSGLRNATPIDATLIQLADLLDIIEAGTVPTPEGPLGPELKELLQRLADRDEAIRGIFSGRPTRRQAETLIARIRGIEPLRVICYRETYGDLNGRYVRRVIADQADRPGMTLEQAKVLTVAQAVADRPTPPTEGELAGPANRSGTPINSAAAGSDRSPRGDRQAAAADVRLKRARRPRRISKVQRAIAILMYRANRPRQSIRVEDIAKEAECSAQNLYKSPDFKREWDAARARRIRRGWKIEGVADCPDDSTLDVG
jgi:hypothetical protein